MTPHQTLEARQRATELRRQYRAAETQAQRVAQRQQYLERQRRPRDTLNKALCYDEDIELLDVHLFDVGPMNYICDACEARHFANETHTNNVFYTCCKNGKVKIDPVPYMGFLEDLLTNNPDTVDPWLIENPAWSPN